MTNRYKPYRLLVAYAIMCTHTICECSVHVLFLIFRDRLLLHRQSMPLIAYTPSSPLRRLKPASIQPYLTCWDTFLLALLFAVQVYCCGLHGLGGFLSHLPFLPLLLTSISCAAVILWAWLFFYHQFCFESDSVTREDCKLRED